MGGPGSGRPPSVDSILKAQEQNAFISNAGSDFFIPNYSGLQAVKKTDPAIGGGPGAESDPIFVALSGGLAYIPISLSGSLAYLPVSLSGSLAYIPTALSGSLPYLPVSLSASLTYLSGSGLIGKGQYTLSGGTGSIVGSSGAGALSIRDTTGLGGHIDFGANTAAIGVSRDGVVSGYDYDGALVFKQKGTNPDGPVEFLFIEEGGDWRFALPTSGAGRGTYNPRSMIIAGPSPNNASAISGSTWGFDKLAMNTSATGADLGVQHDIQVLGTSYLSGSVISNATISGSGLQTTGAISGSNVTSGTDPGHLHTIYALSGGSSYGILLTGNADNDTQSITATVLIACQGAIRRASSPTAYTHVRVPVAGTWQKLWLAVANNDRDAGSCAYVLRDDGVNTNISASIGFGATGAFTCDTETASVAANSLLNAQAIVTAGSSGQYNINNVSSLILT